MFDTDPTPFFTTRRRPHHYATVYDLRRMEANILRLLRTLKYNTHTIMDSQVQLTEKLTKVSTQMDKISAESTKNLQAIQDLQAVIDAGAQVSPELQAAVDKVTTQAQALDDLTPDLPDTEQPPTAPLRSNRPAASGPAGSGTTSGSTAAKS